MNETDITQWIVAWFVERNPGMVPVRTENYYEAGLVDSFGIIELIEEVEEHYGILFEDDDFTLPEFRTIDGLARIISRKAG
jgi:acyl carrier protein